MTFTIVIATHGEDEWSDLAKERAFPSAVAQGCEVLIGHDSHGTRASVRNGLSAQASGEWIITLDADDELAPGYVTAMERAAFPRPDDRMVHIFGPGLGEIETVMLESSPMLLTPMVQYVKRWRKQKPKFWPERDLKDGNWMVVGTAVEKRLLQRVGGWRTFTGSGVLNEWDDWDLWIRCVQAGAGIVKVPDAVYVAHVRESPHYTRTPAQTQEWLREIREANGI